MSLGRNYWLMEGLLSIFSRLGGCRLYQDEQLTKSTQTEPSMSVETSSSSVGLAWMPRFSSDSTSDCIACLSQQRWEKGEVFSCRQKAKCSNYSSFPLGQKTR